MPAKAPLTRRAVRVDLSHKGEVEMAFTSPLVGEVDAEGGGWGVLVLWSALEPRDDEGRVNTELHFPRR